MLEASYEKIHIYLNDKDEDYRFLKMIGFLSKYPKNDREVAEVITFHPNSFGNGIDCRQNCHKTM